MESKQKLPADFRAQVDPLHFLYWMAGYKNEVGEQLRLADGRFCFCSEGEEPDPITSKGIIQLYFLHYPEKAIEYAAIRAKADKMEQALHAAKRKIEYADHALRILQSPGEYLNNWRDGDYKLISEWQEGEKKVPCEEANAECKQMDVCQMYGRCLRENCTGLSNPAAPSSALTPGAPTETGTYYAVIKPYSGDEPQMCVLHYQAHKGIYRAAGHAFNVEVKAEDVIGYVGEVKESAQGAVWVKASDRLPGWGIPVQWRCFDGQQRGFKETIGEMTHVRPVSLHSFEWLDESSGKEVDNDA